MSSLNIPSLRSDTPGTNTKTTVTLRSGATIERPLIHFNNAGAALLTKTVRDAVVGHLDLEMEIGGYEAMAKRKSDLDSLYPSIAEMVGADGADEIAVLESATVAWMSAFYAIPFSEGEVILTSAQEYAANYVAFLQLVERKKITIEVIPADPVDGTLSLPWLQARLEESKKSTSGKKVRLVAVTHIPTNGGVVNPCEEAGAIISSLFPTDEAEVFYLVDACQTVGQKPVDVETLHCHFLSATGRKYLRAPRGTGFLYIRRSALSKVEPIVIDHSGAVWVEKDRYELVPSAKRFEKWESSAANRLGLLAAVRYYLALDRVAAWQRIRELAHSLREQLAGIRVTDLATEGPRVVVQDLGTYEAGTQCGIVTFTVEGCPAFPTSQSFVTALQGAGVNLTVSTIASTRLDMGERGLTEVARLSLHYYNTEEEVAACVAIIKELLTS